MIETKRSPVRVGYPLANCEKAWRRHRIVTRWCWGLFLGWLPYGVLVGFPSERVIARWHLPGWLAFIPFVAYMLAFLVVGNVQARFRCPRCGSRFYAFGPFGLGHNGFARKCSNCQLRKWNCPATATLQDADPRDIVIRPRH